MTLMVRCRSRTIRPSHIVSLASSTLKLVFRAGRTLGLGMLFALISSTHWLKAVSRSLALSNRPTSYTVRSQSNAVSTIDDKESTTVTSARPHRWDDASTRAVVNAKGVVDVVDRPNTGSMRSHAFEPSNVDTGSTQQGQMSTP